MLDLRAVDQRKRSSEAASEWGGRSSPHFQRAASPVTAPLEPESRVRDIWDIVEERRNVTGNEEGLCGP